MVSPFPKPAATGSPRGGSVARFTAYKTWVSIGLDYAFDQNEVDAFVKAHQEIYPVEKYPNGISMVEPERFPQIAEQLLQRGALRPIYARSW
jgi:hypothetical protein